MPGDPEIVVTGSQIHGDESRDLGYIARNRYLIAGFGERVKRAGRFILRNESVEEPNINHEASFGGTPAFGRCPDWRHDVRFSVPCMVAR